jgi:hypothetical protein
MEAADICPTSQARYSHARTPRNKVVVVPLTPLNVVTHSALIALRLLGEALAVGGFFGG